MPFVRFYAASIDAPVNLTGSPAQIQDDPDFPDNDWIISTDPATACTFTITFDISAAPPEVITPNSDWSLAMFVRNSRDSGQSADWGGAIHINAGTQTFTRVAVPATANPTAGGVKQQQIAATTGNVVLVSMTMDFDVVRSGGSPQQRTSLDWDAIEVILEFDDPPVFQDLAGNGVGLSVGSGTMDIVPVELGTADGTGVMTNAGTMGLIPLTELFADGAGFGTGLATADLIPPTDMAADGMGVGDGTSNLDQIPYNMAAEGFGVGNGVGILQQTATPIDVDLTITQPAPGNVNGLVTIQAVEDDPDIPLVRVAINPAHENDPFGYRPDRPDVPDGTHEYDWSSTPYILTQQEIEAFAIFMGLTTGQGPTGFQILGGYGSETLADNAPVLVDVLDGAVPELQGDGAGFGTGSATMVLIPVTELDTAVGAGVGTGVAGTIDLDLTTADGAGAGEGLATMSILLGFVASQALGVGAGDGTLDVVLEVSGGGGQGVGTGQASILVIRDFGTAQGFGQGSGGADSIDVLLDMAATGAGVGTGAGSMNLIEGILWQDPAIGIDNDPWDITLWEAFIQTGASATATATIQSNTNEMTNDPVNAGGGYHEAIHALFDSVRLDVDLVSVITNPAVDSRQAVYISASGAPDANGVPTNGLRLIVDDPAAGTIEARVEKIIAGVITTLTTVDLTTYTLPLFITLAHSGIAWGVELSDTVFEFHNETGEDLELQDIPAGVTWVNTYSLGTADYQWTNFVLRLVPFYNMEGAGVGVGTGVGSFGAEFIDMNATGFGFGTGEGVLDSGIFFVSDAVGVGTGNGTLDLVTMTGEGFGVGTGTGFLKVDELLQASGIGIGTGTGNLVFSTGNWVGAGANVPGGVADAIVQGGPSDAIPQGGPSDATPKGGPSDSDVDGGTATVEIPGDQASVEGP